VKGDNHGTIRLLLVILLVVICVLPVSILCKHEILDPFSYTQMATFEALGEETHLNLHVDTRGRLIESGPESPAFQVLLLTLDKVTSLPSQWLWVFPFIGLIMVLLYYLLAKSIFGSTLIALILAMSVMAFDELYQRPYYTLTYFSVETLYFLTFAILYVHELKTKSSHFNFTILSLLLFMAAFYTHPTAAIWMITFMLAMNFGYLVMSRRRPTAGSYASLSLCFIVIFLGFSKTLYDTWLPGVRLAAEKWAQAPDLIFAESKALFSPGAEPALFAYRGMGPALLTGEPVALISALRYLWIYVPMVLLAAELVRVAVKRRSSLGVRGADIPPVFVIFLFAVIFTVLSHILIYAFSPAVGLIPFFTRPETLLFPLLSVISLIVVDRIRLRRSRTFTDTRKELRPDKLDAIPRSILIFLIVLTLLTFLKFGLYWDQNFQKTTTTFLDSRPSAVWLAQATYEEPTIVSDQHTHGKFLMEGLNHGKFFILQPLTFELYEAMVTSKETQHLEGKYTVIDVKSADVPMYSFGDRFQPIAPYLASLETNPQLTKIYASNAIWIFRGR